jgi:transcriptional regulator with XRE-family HTH domain
MRKTSDQFLANDNKKREAKAMSGVNAFTPDLAAAYARKMIELESRGNGDQLNALERVGRRVGMTARSLRRLVNGETKDPGISLFARIHAAYLEQCGKMAASLLQQIEIEKARFGSEHFEDLGAELQALRSKIEAQMERHKT